MSDKPRDYGRKLTAADRLQFAIIGAVGIGVGIATYNVATGIGAAIVAALVVMFLGIGEE